MRANRVKANGEEVQRRRCALGMTQDELAIKVGCHKKNIENAERGRTQNRNTLEEIAQALGCTLEELLDKSAVSSSSNTPAKTFRMRGGAPTLGSRLFGRNEDLKEVRQRLKNAILQDSSGTLVVSGPPGVGKSSLLNQLSHDQALAKLFPDGGLWTAVGQSGTALDLLGVWGRALKISAARLTRVDEAAAAIREKIQHRRLLVIVDDVWTDAQASALRVAGAGSVTMFATRIPLLADRLAPSPIAVYSLSGLSNEEGINLLASYANDVVAKHRGACEELVKNVEGLPLALVVAGKLLHRESVSGGDLKQVFASIREDARSLLSQSVPPDMVNLLEQTTPDVAAVLRRSTAGLSAESQDRFSLLGGLAPAPAKLPLFLLAKIWNLQEKEAKNVARNFADLGLLDVDRRGQYSIHPLMKALALHEWEIGHASRRKRNTK